MPVVHRGKKFRWISASAFADETASESPAPGGGSISAYMVYPPQRSAQWWQTSAHKAGWDDRWEEFFPIGARKAESNFLDRLILASR